MRSMLAAARILKLMHLQSPKLHETNNLPNCRRYINAIDACLIGKVL